MGCAEDGAFVLTETCRIQKGLPTSWQKEFFENGAAAFQPQERPHRQVEEKHKRIEFLEKKVQTKDEVLAEHVALRNNAWGTLTGVWTPHDTQVQIVDFVRRWSEMTEIGAGRFIAWPDIAYKSVPPMTAPAKTPERHSIRE